MHSLGFGIEKMGLVPIRYPLRTLAVLAAFTGFCIVGLFNLQPEGRLSELYRGNSANYADYQKISKLFPVSELDVLLLISGKDLLRQKTLDDIQAIQEEVEFLEGIDSTLSMFSLRGKPDPRTGKSPPLFPAELRKIDKQKFAAALKNIEKHPDVYDNMLSKKDANGQQTSLIIVTLKAESIKEGTLYGVLEGLKNKVREMAEPAKLEFHLSGVPVIQQEIRNSINHDTVVFNIGGFLLGTLISFYFIRRFALVIMVSIASILANIWVLGLLGHFGQTLNAFMTIVPPLIMVIAVSDGMHMVLAILKDMQEGKSKHQAVKNAVLSIGPACVLTSLTTTIAILSMTITDSAVIRTFGITAAMGTLAAFIAVILVIPTLSILMIKDEKKYRVTDKNDQTWKALERIEKLSEGFADWTSRWWRDLTAVGLITCLFFTILHLQLKPKYQLSDEIPDVPALNNAMDLVDEKLGGGDYIHILVNYGKDKTATDKQVLASIGESHRILKNLPQVTDVNSLEKTRLWFKNNGIKDIAFLKGYLDEMPDYLRVRLVNKEKHAAIVSAKITNLGSSELADLIKRVKNNLVNMEREYPGISFTISGLSAVSALQSTSIIGQLNQGLLMAIVIVVGLIGLAFRSVNIALISIAPNLFPIVAAGAVLHFTGSGLQFASILGLTVAFGLAVDDSIHFFNRYFLERHKIADRVKASLKSDERAATSNPKKLAQEQYDNEVEAVEKTVAHIGPILILTTAILVCGLSVTVLSNLSVTRLFGELSMATLSAALLADLFFLPALIIATLYFKHLFRKLRTLDE
ncbi:MAG: efflux RND transporter permease subunit [Hyphomicrobiaceae bacterium]|nr:efflux RND transporter permease subunit [Hyphomicrobiaceae bacterium]